MHLRGCTSDHINVAGRNVAAIIEQALREHEAVAECLVFGVPSGDADRIDHIVACVTADPSSTTEELKQSPLLETSKLAGAARVVVCEITRGQQARQGFARALARHFLEIRAKRGAAA